MYNVEPQGMIYLCKTPLENDYKNQLTFTNSASQATYFNTTVLKTFSDYTYQRHDSSVKVGANIDDIIKCNYMFYRNVGFSDKVYYCFITDMQYVNENCTLITFETDVFQTYQFNIKYKMCFTEREHVNDDTIGINTVPENLETGDYINISNNEDASYVNLTDNYICISMSDIPGKTGTPVNKYNGIYSGLSYLIFKDSVNATGFLLACDNVKWTDFGDKSYRDAVLSVFIVPKGLVNGYLGEAINYEGFYYYLLKSSTTALTLLTKNLSNPTNLGNGYIPVNNKLLTYPYRYLLVSNNCGTDIEFRYENFNNLLPSFKIYGNINTGCSLKCVPQNYNSISGDNFENSLNCGKLPTCAWTSNVYINWLTQNGLNMAVSNLTGAIKPLFTGKISDVASGASGIFNNLISQYEHSKIPNQAQGNINSSDIMFSLNKNNISFYHMGIKEEYAKIIDNYFTMFGYKVNKLKVPNITGRANWNYVKTIECNFDGDIPQAHLNIIRSMFNSGVTLWHNPNTIYNYNLSNNII